MLRTQEYFEANLKPNFMEKLDCGSPILIRLGRDIKGNPIFSVSQISEENAFPVSKAIDVISEKSPVGYRYDLILKDAKYSDMFYKVLDDLLYIAEGETDRKHYAKKIIERYRAWSSFWKKEKKGLTKEEKQGLLGELIYIKHNLKKGMDANELLKSWRGPESTPQDFIRTGFWAEVKTVKHNADSVSISSLEQLDNPPGSIQKGVQNVIGRLVVIKVNLTPAIENPLTLPGLVSELKELLKNDSIAYDAFLRGLELTNYDDTLEKESDFKAELVDLCCYNANADDFPKYRTKDVPNAIVGMKYVLSLPALSNWLVEEK